MVLGLTFLFQAQRLVQIRERVRFGGTLPRADSLSLSAVDVEHICVG